MENIQLYYVLLEKDFNIVYGNPIGLYHLVFEPLLADFDFDYDIIDLDLVERPNGDYAVKVKIDKKY